MADQQTPEFLRLSLQDLAIRVKICKLGGIEETLSQALDPPSTKNIRRAIDALIDVRALTPSEELTPLGLQLARLPLDVFLGKLIILGSIFKCVDAVVTIAAILSSKSPFSAPFGARSQADTIRLGFRRGECSFHSIFIALYLDLLSPHQRIPNANISRMHWYSRLPRIIFIFQFLCLSLLTTHYSGDSDLLTIYNAYLAWKRVSLSGHSEYQSVGRTFLISKPLQILKILKGNFSLALWILGSFP